MLFHSVEHTYQILAKTFLSSIRKHCSRWQTSVQSSQNREDLWKARKPEN